MHFLKALCLVMTGNNQPGRMVVGQTFTIGRPSQLLDICFYWIMCIAHMEYAGVSFLLGKCSRACLIRGNGLLNQ